MSDQSGNQNIGFLMPRLMYYFSGPDGIRGKGWGRVICGDVGQSAVEELDMLQKGANYGWNNLEGTYDYCTTCPKGTEKQG